MAKGMEDEETETVGDPLLIISDDENFNMTSWLFAVFCPILFYFCGTAFRTDYPLIPSSMPKIF